MDNKLVFDLDGVLLDSENDLRWLDNAINKTLEEIGLAKTPCNMEKLYPGNIRNYLSSLKDSGIDYRPVWEIRNRNYTEEKIKWIRKGRLKPFSDVEELYRLRPYFDLSIISNSPQAVVDAFIETNNYADLFEAGVGRGSTYEALKYIKPHSYLYKILKEKVGGGNFTYVGDTETDREFTKRVGVNFLYLNRDGGAFTGLDVLIDYVMKNYS